MRALLTPRRTLGLFSILAACSLAACGGKAASPSSSSSDSSSSNGNGSSTTTGSSSSGGTSGRTDDAGAQANDAATGESTFPLGVYGNCVQTVNQGASSASLPTGGTVALSSSGSTLVAMLSDYSVSIDFAPTSGTTATLAPNQSVPGPWASCGGGVSPSGGIADPGPGPGDFEPNSGVLNYDANTLFVSLVGNIVPQADDCDGGPADLSLTCTMP
jgi:hypothetical protein